MSSMLAPFNRILPVVAVMALFAAQPCGAVEDVWSLLSESRKMADAASYRVARVKAERARRAFHGMHEDIGEAKALTVLGAVASEQGNFGEAESRYREALRLPGVALREDIQANLFTGLGNVLMYRERHGEAQKSFQNALRIYKSYLELVKKPEDKRSIRSAIAAVYQDMGLDFYQQADYPKALAFLDTSLKWLGEDDVAGRAASLNGKGLIRQAEGEYEKANALFDRSRKLASSPLGDAIYWYNLGVSFEEMGLDLEAIHQFQRSLDAYRKKGMDWEAHDALYRLAVLKARNDFLHDPRDPNDPVALLHQALKMFREHEIGWMVDRVSMDLCDVYMDTGRNMDEARRLLHERGDSLHWGRYLLLSGDNTGAAAKFKSAVAKNGDVSRQMAAQTGYGLALEGLGRADEAATRFREAIRLIETSRDDSPQTGRSRFLDASNHGFRRLDAYEGLVRILLRRGKNGADESFFWSEHTKARVFAELLSRTAWNAGSRAELIGLSRRISALERAAISVRGAERRLRPEIDRLKLRRDKLSGGSGQARYPKGVPLKNDELLIEYDIMTSSTAVFVVGSSGLLDSFVVGLGRDDLKAKVAELRRPFEESARLGRVQPVTEEQLKLGSELYDLLLKRALSHAAGRKVIIVPDEGLAALPFEGLVEKLPKPLVWDGQRPPDVGYVGDSRVLTYWQSATSLAMLRRMKRRVPTGMGVLVIADPVFGKSDPRWKVVAASTGEPATTYKWSDFRRIPQSGQMAHDVSVKLPDVVAWTGSQASEVKVRCDMLDKYGLAVLFNTHGIVTDIAPGLSQAAILLSNPAVANRGAGSTASGDGVLTMTKVMSLKMPTELAAAFACESGGGEVIGGEGSMNLGRAFLFAGARSAIVTLWSVDAECTRLMSEKLMEGIAAGHSKEDALLSARRAVRQQGYDNPFFWASMVLMGERDLAVPLRPKPSVHRKSNPTYITLILMAAVLMIAYAAWRRRGGGKCKIGNEK